jgi:hypothetical protein
MKKTNNNSRPSYLSTKSSDFTKTIDFSRISKDKIDEYITLMHDHQMNCVKVGNFIEAELAKQRVLQLKKIQEKKVYKDVKKRQNVDKKNFNAIREKELKEYKKGFDDKYVEEISKLEDILNELKKKQEQELNDYFTNYEKNISKEMRPSNELMEKQKQLNYYVKTEE